ncbi:hypothetical protein ACU635_39500 [[Actinomadura] parvosata]|uniref:hypothetical protein n=1 Tax=[Actinomadura] parvosata TaxID=1955412 RepID=UPI00406CA6DF
MSIAYRPEDTPDRRPAPTRRERLFWLQAEIDDLESAGLTWRAAACRAERDRLAARYAAAIRQGADPAG